MWRLKDGFQLGTLMDGDKHIYDIQLDSKAQVVYFGFGFNVMVYRFTHDRIFAHHAHERVPGQPGVDALPAAPGEAQVVLGVGARDGAAGEVDQPSALAD